MIVVAAVGIAVVGAAAWWQESRVGPGSPPDTPPLSNAELVRGDVEDIIDLSDEPDSTIDHIGNDIWEGPVIDKTALAGFFVHQYGITLDEGKQVVSTFVLRYCPDEGL